MDPTTEKQLRKQFRQHSTAKLRMLAAQRGPKGLNVTPEAFTAEQMVSEREAWIRFFTHGLVAWLALALSVVALVTSA